jgi:hypothetical protein
LRERGGVGHFVQQAAHRDEVEVPGDVGRFQKPLDDVQAGVGRGMVERRLHRFFPGLDDPVLVECVDVGKERLEAAAHFQDAAMPMLVQRGEDFVAADARDHRLELAVAILVRVTARVFGMIDHVASAGLQSRV